MFYIFLDNNILNGAGEHPQLTENVKNIAVKEDLYNAYIKDPELFIWNGSDIVENPEYNLILKQREIKKKKEEILKQLDILDKKRIRAVCENETKEDSTHQSWLEFYNSQAIELRNQLSQIK